MLVEHLFCRPRPVCKSLKKKEISKLTSYTAATIPHTKSINPLKLKLLMWFHRKKPAVASSGPSEFTAWGKYGKLFLLVSGCFLAARIPAGASSVQSFSYNMTCKSVGYRVRFPRASRAFSRGCSCCFAAFRYLVHVPPGDGETSVRRVMLNGVKLDSHSIAFIAPAWADSDLQEPGVLTYDGTKNEEQVTGWKNPEGFHVLHRREETLGRLRAVDQSRPH